VDRPEYSIRVESDGDGHVVHLVGDIDLSAAPVLRAALHTESGDVVLDMSETTFLDSTAIGVIVASWKRHHEEGRRFVARDVPESTMHVFELTGVDELLLPPGDGHDAGSARRS